MWILTMQNGTGMGGEGGVEERRRNEKDREQPGQ